MAIQDPPKPPESEEKSRSESYVRDEALEILSAAREGWEQSTQRVFEKRPAWKTDFTTVSNMEVPHLVTPEQVADIDPLRDIVLEICMNLNIR